MSESRRIDVFVAKPRLRDSSQPARSEAPLWAVVVLGALLLIGLIVVATVNDPALYGFVVSMVIAVIAERLLDGRSPSWGEGHVVADIDDDALVFRAYRWTRALAVIFLIAVLCGSCFFVAVLRTPSIDLPVWFSAFGLLLVAGIAQGVRYIVRSLRRVDVRLSADGVTAVGLFGRETTTSWSSIVTAFTSGRSIQLTTTDGTLQWPAHQMRPDPVAVSLIIDTCARRPSVEVAEIVSVIDGLASTPSAG